MHAERASDSTPTDLRPGEGTVLICPMKRRHLRGVVAIENANSHRPWSQDLFAGELRMPTSRIYNVALDAHRVLGFCGLMLIADEGHITNIAVDEGVRRMGIARRLLGRTVREAIERDISSLTLEVRITNHGAQQLYRRFGFVPSGIRPRYYAELNEDALIMWAHDVDTPEYAARLEELDV